MVLPLGLLWHLPLASRVGAAQGARLLAGKPGEVTGPPGQYELFRRFALGNFRDLLVAVAQDPAMIIWLDGDSNTKDKPQENFGRELMELFSRGVGFYTESDVYAAARVFTGWNLKIDRGTGDGQNAYSFIYNANQHDTTDKTFSFGNVYETLQTSTNTITLTDGCARSSDKSLTYAQVVSKFFGMPGGELIGRDAEGERGRGVAERRDAALRGDGIAHQPLQRPNRFRH